jgi:NADH dehydrogenase
VSAAATTPAAPAAPRRVVIVGGGFAGLFAARALRRAPVEVTLVDRAQHHLFQPLLYQVATGMLSEGQIAIPLRRLLARQRNARCELAEVVDVDPAAHHVVARRPGGTCIELPYDDLVVAVGVEQSYFGHDEFAQWAPGMKTIGDALTIRRKVFGAFEMAETAEDPAERRRWLTFALVGAGPTGVELAGQIRELATRTLRHEFRTIDPEEARVLLFDGGREPLASFGPALSRKASEALEELGVEVVMGSVVTLVDADGLMVRDHDGTTTRHAAGTVLWTAGVEAPPVVAALAAATGATRDRAGRVAVGPDLTVPDHPDIAVIGDAMSVDRLPGVAEVAMQAGFYTGRRLRRESLGRGRARPFRYHDLGSAAYISRGRAVVSAGPIHLTGIAGWLGWLFVHIAFLTGYRNRLGAVLSWATTFARDIRRERAFTTEGIDPGRGEYAVAPVVDVPRRGPAVTR